MNLKLIAGLGAALAFAAVIILALWYRGDAIKQKDLAETWQTTAETFERANKNNLAVIDSKNKAIAANDKIAGDLAKEVADLKARRVETRTVIREVYRDDPQAADWGATPVPDGLRDAASRR